MIIIIIFIIIHHYQGSNCFSCLHSTSLANEGISHSGPLWKWKRELILIVLNSLFPVQFSHHQTLLTLFGWLFQELPAIRSLLIVAIPFQPKIRTMTTGLVIVLWPLKEPGGTRAAMILIWMDFIIMGSIHLMPMESTGITGRDITILSRELRWK